MTLRPWLLSLFAISFATTAVADDPVPLWQRFEKTLTAQSDADPQTDLAVELTPPSGKTRTIDGFWDGGRTWRFRVMADEEGTWRYRTHSKPSTAGLDDQSGSFASRPANDSKNRFALHGRVGISKNHRYLEHADGTPFFWLADTVWNGPLLSSDADWKTYLADRDGKHFSVVQFNLLAPWRTADSDADGQVAFTGRSPVRINPAFFQRLDRRMDEIQAQGMLAAPVMIWSLTKKDPGFDLPEDDLIRIARYELARYGANHVAWILAGDNPYNDKTTERWKRVGRAVFADKPHAPVMTHPTGMNWPWESWRDEPWLDIFGYQSGHGDNADVLRWIHSGPPAQHWQKEPPRVFINLEPPYEDHIAYQSKLRHTAYSTRRASYWSLLNAPTAGVTYGGHGVWSWHTAEGEPPTDHGGTGIAQNWKVALSLPGSTQMKHLADLMTSTRWWTLRPDQDLLSTQPGGDDPARFVAAARSESGDLAVIYLPVGGSVSLKPDRLKKPSTAQLFDPRTGRRQTALHSASGKYDAPDAQDWVLLLEPRNDKASSITARPDDVKSVDNIIAALYDVISGDKGEARDWDRFRALFLPDARLVAISVSPEGKAATRTFSVNEFAKITEASSKQAGFFESELARKVDSFGRMTNALSSYESRRAKNEPPFSRGINSFQLFNDGTRRWVVTIYWDSERP